MKKMILMSLVFLSTTAFAGNKNIEQRISYAAKLLAEMAEGSQTYTAQQGLDAKSLMKEIALKEQMTETEEDFESNWVNEVGTAWGADEMLFGLESLPGAISYIKTNLEDRLEQSEKTDADKIKFADDYTKANQAFEILRSIKSIKFGIIPTGAVQCGVTFPSLLILDTENGQAHQITMEGSGC